MPFDFSLDGAWATVEDNVDFSLADVDLCKGGDGIENSRYMRPRVYESIAQKVTLEHADDFVRTWEFRPGSRMFAVVSGNFVFGDVLGALAKRLNMRKITIQTLSMSERNINVLGRVLDTCKNLERLRLVLSDYFYSHERRPGQLVPHIYETLDREDGPEFDCAYASVHTKIVSIETANGGKLVMDGSANLRSSRNIEQLRVECDADLYDWVEAMADRIFAAYSTINKDRPRPKSVRGERLWGAVEGSER